MEKCKRINSKFRGRGGDDQGEISGAQKCVLVGTQVSASYPLCLKDSFIFSKSPCCCPQNLFPGDKLVRHFDLQPPEWEGVALAEAEVGCRGTRVPEVSDKAGHDKGRGQ